MLLQIGSQAPAFTDASSITLIAIGLVIYLYYIFKHSGRKPITGTTRRIGKHAVKKKTKRKVTKRKTTSRKTTKRKTTTRKTTRKKPRRKTK